MGMDDKLMGEIIELDVVTRLNLDPERVLRNASGKLESVTIIGTTKDGEEYFSSSLASGPDVLWDLERAKMKLLQIPDKET